MRESRKTVVHDLLRRLATLEPSGRPVLSIYLDVRPQATGEAPGRRGGLTLLKGRLREIEKTLPPRGDALESFRTDAALVELYLEEEAPRAAQGLAIFASAGHALFEVVESGVLFEDQVSIGPTPDLFQLARLLDEQETAVVALVDSNTARLFVSRTGALAERGGADEDSISFQKRSMDGWPQARYQRHIDKHDFAGEAAVAIEDLMEQEGATRLVLAGDEVAITPLRDALTPQTAALTTDVLRVHIRTSRHELQRAVAPVLAQAEADDAHSAAERLIDAVRADGLGVAGLERTQAALAQGQVDELLIDPSAEIDESTRNELVRMATLTGATVEVLEGHDDLLRLGGVGALLRYRLTDRDQVATG